MQNQAGHRDKQQTGDWFNHNSPGGAAAAGVKSSPVRKLNQESEAWFNYTPGATTMTSPSANNRGSSSSSSDTVAAQQPSTPSNGNQNWYRHDTSPTKELHPVGVSEPRVKLKPLTDERLAREAAAGDPNDWYRHDHQGGDASGPVGNNGGSSKKQGQTRALEDTLWFAHDGGAANGTPSLSPPASKTRHSGHDAGLYFQRDKTGTGADWFPHEHRSNNGTDLQESPSSAATGYRSSTGNRTNAESPAWFPHDQPPSNLSPRSAASPEVQRMQARASGNDVRQILRVDDNLEQQHRGASSRSDNQHGAADRYTESLIDKFQRQSGLGTVSGQEHHLQ